MTPYEAFLYSSNALRTIESIQQAIKNGQKRDMLPVDIQGKISQKNIDRMVSIQKNALAIIETEINEFL